VGPAAGRVLNRIGVVLEQKKAVSKHVSLNSMVSEGMNAMRKESNSVGRLAKQSLLPLLVLPHDRRVFGESECRGANAIDWVCPVEGSLIFGKDEDSA
jgi:hypothetical protein